ncbi:unnamed protein product [Haemonchus placei]|uniref:CX9C domain-containing protein n=1 Tax=Haemonchus placei TaxID=6290 RepID=A0A0N4WU30_HAEPC|nr:unnamed protein product [Haemonchus placei]
MPNERRILKFASTLAACTPEAAAYGACVSRQAERITKDACANEFSKLLDCVKKQLFKEMTDARCSCSVSFSWSSLYLEFAIVKQKNILEK